MDLKDFIKSIPLAKKAAVIKYDDCGLIAFNKGSGLMSHPNPNSPSDKNHPFVRAKYNHKEEYYSWTLQDGTKNRLYLINRLDSPTSGVILASANFETAEAVKESFKQKEAHKTYYAICGGKPLTNVGEWVDFLDVRKYGNFVRAQSSSKGANRAISKFEVEKIDENKLGLSLIKLEPLTGRTHQLRIQCAKRGFPIVGDQTYGNFSLNREIRRISSLPRLFLHCASTKLEFLLGDKTVTFEAKAPLPESFKILIDYNGLIILKSRKTQNV